MVGAEPEDGGRVPRRRAQRGGQVRPERREPVDPAGPHQREPPGQPDRLPHEKRADRVAGRPARVGQRAAHRFGERHAEHQQPQRRDLHTAIVPERALGRAGRAGSVAALPERLQPRRSRGIGRLPERLAGSRSRSASAEEVAQWSPAPGAP